MTEKEKPAMTPKEIEEQRRRRQKASEFAKKLSDADPKVDNHRTR